MTLRYACGNTVPPHLLGGGGGVKFNVFHEVWKNVSLKDMFSGEAVSFPEESYSHKILVNLQKTTGVFACLVWRKISSGKCFPIFPCFVGLNVLENIFLCELIFLQLKKYFPYQEETNFHSPTKYDIFLPTKHSLVALKSFLYQKSFQSTISEEVPNTCPKFL